MSPTPSASGTNGLGGDPYTSFSHFGNVEFPFVLFSSTEMDEDGRGVGTCDGIEWGLEFVEGLGAGMVGGGRGRDIFYSLGVTFNIFSVFYNIFRCTGVRTSPGI